MIKETTKSPFYVIENFISPMACEDIIDRLAHSMPDTDVENNLLKTVKANKLTEIRLLPKFQELMPKLEEYYGFKEKGILPFIFEWYPQDFKAVAPRCENSRYIDGQWSIINDYAFCAILFLNEYNDAAPFDDYYEVFGGKLQFPNHGFGFNPKRGTLVIFPADHHFINHTDKVKAGDLNQIRIHIASTEPYIYNSNNFKGGFQDWFSDK